MSNNIQNASPNNSDSNMKKKTIGDYVLQNTIGTGAFSKVKLATDKKTNALVAIKIINKQKMDSGDIQRVKREIKILTSVNHPNIIQVNEILENDTNYYIVMEYCFKGELFHYICSKKKLNEEECAFMFYQIINAVDYLHKNNISHRDIKPENILLQSNGLLKLIDFGLSNYFDKSELLKTACGSPCYAPPEMIKNKTYNAKAVDIWSIGIVLYAMLCGKLPFEDKNSQKLFQKIQKEPPTFPPNLSKNAKQALHKMLIKEPCYRIKINEIKKLPFYISGQNIFFIKYNETYETIKNYSFFFSNTSSYGMAKYETTADNLNTNNNYTNTESVKNNILVDNYGDDDMSSSSQNEHNSIISNNSNINDISDIISDTQLNNNTQPNNNINTAKTPKGDEEVKNNEPKENNKDNKENVNDPGKFTEKVIKTKTEQYELKKSDKKKKHYYYNSALTGITDSHFNSNNIINSSNIINKQQHCATIGNDSFSSSKNNVITEIQTKKIKVTKRQQKRNKSTHKEKEKDNKKEGTLEEQQQQEQQPELKEHPNKIKEYTLPQSPFNNNQYVQNFENSHFNLTTYNMFKNQMQSQSRKHGEDTIYQSVTNQFEGNPKGNNMTFTQAFNEKFYNPNEEEPNSGRNKKNKGVKQRLNKSNIVNDKAQKRIYSCNKKTDSIIINKAEFEKMNNDILSMDKQKKVQTKRDTPAFKSVSKNRSISKESTIEKFYKKFHLNPSIDVDNDCKENMNEDEISDEKNDSLIRKKKLCNNPNNSKNEICLKKREKTQKLALLSSKKQPNGKNSKFKTIPENVGNFQSPKMTETHSSNHGTAKKEGKTKNHKEFIKSPLTNNTNKMTFKTDNKTISTNKYILTSENKDIPIKRVSDVAKKVQNLKEKLKSQRLNERVSSPARFNNNVHPHTINSNREGQTNTAVNSKQRKILKI